MNVDKIKRCLSDHRDEILRAELAGWLHSAGRLREGWHPKGSFNYERFSAPSQRLIDAAAGDKKARRAIRTLMSAGPFATTVESDLGGLLVAFPSEQWPMGELLMVWAGGDFVIQPNPPLTNEYGFRLAGINGGAPQLLNAAHRRASIMKRGRARNADGPKSGNRRSDVFGFGIEVKWAEDLDAAMRTGLEYGENPQRHTRMAFRSMWQAVSRNCYADNRVPINDLTVWDYSRSVGAFFKAAVAKAWIENALPSNAADVRWVLIAVGYPGLEFVSGAVRITDAISRRDWIQDKLDHFGEVFEFQYPLANEVYRDENGAVYLAADFEGLEETVLSLIREIEADDDDLQPSLSTYREDEEVLPIGEAIKGLTRNVPIRAARARAWWQSGPAVICPVCQLRPKGDHGAPDDRYLCVECLRRRQNLKRSREWLDGRGQDTIWIDEATDSNGICALITGRLELDDWLTESEARSPFRLLLTTKDGLGRKEPVFLRVEACWSTAKEFWTRVTGECLPGATGKRFRLRGFLTGRPLDTHVYEAGIAEHSIAAVWDAHDGSFVTVSGRADVLSRLNAGTKLTFRLPVGYQIREDAGRYEHRDQAAGDGEIRFEVSIVDAAPDFRPTIPLMAEPRHFLAVVPGREAIATCNAIIDMYRERLGKVWTMLPMALGIVFFDRRTPIYAVLQAGRKMLAMPTPRMVAKRNPDTGRLEFERRGKEHVADGYRLEEAEIRDEYFSRVESASGASLALKNLAADEELRVSVSHIDFCHLETTGHRYRLAYSHEAAQLDPERPTRALTMEEFQEMTSLWTTLSDGLTIGQINELFAASEQKREEWEMGCPSDEPTYMAFLRSLIRQAEWKTRPDAKQVTRLARQTARGLLRDAVELNLKILKQQKGRSDQQ